MYRRFATKWVGKWPVPRPILSENIPNSPEFVSFANKCMTPVRKTLEDWVDWVRQMEQSRNVSTTRTRLDHRSHSTSNGQFFRMSGSCARLVATIKILGASNLAASGPSLSVLRLRIQVAVIRLPRAMRSAV